MMQGAVQTGPRGYIDMVDIWALKRLLCLYFPTQYCMCVVHRYSQPEDILLEALRQKTLPSLPEAA